MNRHVRMALLATSALAVIGLNDRAFAQTDGAGSQIDDIVVTAQRRAESLQRTPLAVTAITAEDLESANIQSTRDLMQVTPSLQVSTQLAGNGGGSATFTMRGLGQVRSANGSEPAVGVYIDNFYYPSLQGSIFSILDMERVEVLRGPQGTLFGRNTIGGAIRYITQAPAFDDTFGYVQGTLGSYERSDVQGSVNLPIAANAALRVTGGLQRTDGYVEQANGGDDAGGQETDLLRAQLRFEPAHNFEIDLSGQYTRTLVDGFAYYVPAPFQVLSFSNAGRWNTSPAGLLNPYDSRYASACDYCQPGTDRREFSETWFRSANATMTWDITPSLTLTSYTGWQEVENESMIDQDRTPLPISDNPGASLQTALSQELQLNAALFDDRLNLVSGVYYLDQHEENYPGRAGPRVANGNVQPFFLSDRKTTTRAAYVDGTFALNDMVSLLAGIRYSTDRRENETSNEAGDVLVSLQGDFPATTWRAGAQVQWTPDLMTYATVSRGFRAGGFSQISVESALIEPFRPEYATNYEIGARWDGFNGRLRLNPTLFFNQWEDIQIQRVTPNPAGGTPFIYLVNAGDAEAVGFELESTWAITEQLEAFGSMSLLDIEYTKIAAGVTEINLQSDFMRAPELMYNVGLRYNTEVQGYEVAATTNWSWQDAQFSAATLPDGLVLPSYGLLSARLEIADPRDRYTLAIFATNLTDEVHYVGGAWLYPVGTLNYDLGRPQEFGASLKVSF